MKRLDITLPNEIDGNPGHVARVAIAQLGEVLDDAAELLTATETQVHNAFLTEVLAGAPATSSEELTELWPESDLAAEFGRLRALLTSLRQKLAALELPR